MSVFPRASVYTAENRSDCVLLVIHIVIPVLTRAGVKACHTGHILSGKSYKAEGLVTLSSLFYDMNSGSASCTLTGQKHLFRCFSIFFMPARMLARLDGLNLTYVLD